MKRLSTEKRSLFSPEMIRLIKMILTASGINAISTLTRVKTSILSTMTDSRLNHLLVVHIYKKEVDKTDIKLITNESVKVKPRIQNYNFWVKSI